MLNRKVFVLLFIGVLFCELLISSVEAGGKESTSKSKGAPSGVKSKLKNAIKSSQKPASKVAGKLREYADNVKQEYNREITDEEVEARHASHSPADNFGRAQYDYIFGEADRITAAYTGQDVVHPYDYYQGDGYASGKKPQYLKDYDDYVKQLNLQEHD
ncbi:uncharacterized protein LOC116338128 [Contarinia nasturtii]|uniref:uncharacterized protein LOC116338128 n=1 Tax=Contarinia nasturtii TaxID=265458 RepID=UPI0012D38C2A|nr:uncharacterized protein LOC116338128 [Contarinia nasturtii]